MGRVGRSSGRLLGGPLTGSVLAAAAVGATAGIARSHAVSDPEERLFRWFNGAPDRLHAPAWVVMQSGSLGGVFAIAGGLAGLRRNRAAATAAVAGTAVWAGVKLVKPLVRRGRPADHLDGVIVRGQPQTGLGYPSGHAAVALTLGIIVPRTQDLRTDLAAGLFAGLVGTTRMYVGAHLPLDVAGGLAIGMLAGRASRSALRMCP